MTMFLTLPSLSLHAFHWLAVALPALWSLLLYGSILLLASAVIWAAYRLCIYPYFVSPLRHLPGPRVSPSLLCHACLSA